MPFFVVHAETQNQADALKSTLEADILGKSRAHSVSTAIVPDRVLEARGVGSLPAILWIEEWPDDFLILHHGSNPTIEEMQSWLTRYDLASRPTSQIISATLFGTITDRSTGLPLIGATVSLSPMPLADGPIQAITDEDGDYELGVIHPGNLVLHFTFDADRRSCARRQVLVRNGRSLRVDMQLDGRTVGQRPYTVIEGTFAGRYVTASETNSFTPDPGTIVDGNGNPVEVRDAWVEFETPEWAEFFEEDKKYRVRWEGRLCGPGSYGHFGGGRYLVLVEDVLDHEEEDPVVPFPP